MDINELLFLVSKASNGKDNFEKSSVEFNDYGLVFKDFDSDLSYITYLGSNGVFGADIYRYMSKKPKKTSSSRS